MSLKTLDVLVSSSLGRAWATVRELTEGDTVGH